MSQRKEVSLLEALSKVQGNQTQDTSAQSAQTEAGEKKSARKLVDPLVAASPVASYYTPPAPAQKSYAGGRDNFFFFVGILVLVSFISAVFGYKFGYRNGHNEGQTLARQQTTPISPLAITSTAESATAFTNPVNTRAPSLTSSEPTAKSMATSMTQESLIQSERPAPSLRGAPQELTSRREQETLLPEDQKPRITIQTRYFGPRGLKEAQEMVDFLNTSGFESFRNDQGYVFVGRFPSLSDDKAKEVLKDLRNLRYKKISLGDCFFTNL